MDRNESALVYVYVLHVFRFDGLLRNSKSGISRKLELCFSRVLLRLLIRFPLTTISIDSLATVLFYNVSFA